MSGMTPAGQHGLVEEINGVNRQTGAYANERLNLEMSQISRQG